ncbi:hypothetical protein AWC22_11935 [Mycobacterium riyadhense]|uniref:Uncharacterized protein n=1 Tax=Mycobacterium riyadhense TaxID=486698 RepID=A0A1X2DC75_9MYCO|nr:hypothetical protein AWC22_11935 [Mycobacterium riyadhense]
MGQDRQSLSQPRVDRVGAKLMQMVGSVWVLDCGEPIAERLKHESALACAGPLMAVEACALCI